MLIEYLVSSTPFFDGLPSWSFSWLSQEAKGEDQYSRVALISSLRTYLQLPSLPSLSYLPKNCNQSKVFTCKDKYRTATNHKKSRSKIKITCPRKHPELDTTDAVRTALLWNQLWEVARDCQPHTRPIDVGTNWHKPACPSGRSTSFATCGNVSKTTLLAGLNYAERHK